MKILFLLLALSLPAGATSIYDNTVTDLSERFVFTTNEIGNEVVLGGTERWMTNLTLEYFLTNTNGLVMEFPEINVRVYRNNGADFNGYATPGDVIWESGWFGPLPATDRSTIAYSGADFGSGGVWLGESNGIPFNTITFTAQFRGFGESQIGLDLYSPPVAGKAYGDFWMLEEGWALKRDTNGVHVNFAAVIEAQGKPLDRSTIEITPEYLIVHGVASSYDVERLGTGGWEFWLVTAPETPVAISEPGIFRAVYHP